MTRAERERLEFRAWCVAGFLSTFVGHVLAHWLAQYVFHWNG